MVTKVKGAVSLSPKYLAAAPTTLTYAVGDITFNSSSAPNIGWRCTVAGTPGTHKPFGSTYLEGTVNSVPATIADGTNITRTITVAGAVLGDFLEVSTSVTSQGLIVIGWIDAADTVKVTFQNETGGSINLASLDIYARVTKRV